MGVRIVPEEPEEACRDEQLPYLAVGSPLPRDRACDDREKRRAMVCSTASPARQNGTVSTIITLMPSRRAVPPMAVALNPAGKVSVTVTEAEVGAVPTLLTVIV